jgi:NADPH:quinone reductase-like Zn-dependent oxidoreductase
MKAIVVHEYGRPEVLKFEDFADPLAKSGDVVIRVAASSVNPIDIKRRSGVYRDFAPIQFPGILGKDVAGTIAALGTGVSGWKVGEQVLAFADATYAQLCPVNSSTLARVPAGMVLADAAALPCVATTAFQLVVESVGIKAGQTVLVSGAVGSVGRCAVFVAKQRGANVIAGVRKKQLADAAKLGADSVVAIDDDAAIAKLPPLDAVADTVGGPTAEKLIAKLKSGGVFASVLGAPANAKQFPSVKSVGMRARPDAQALRQMSEAVASGKLTVPISKRFPLKEAAAAHAAVEGGTSGKILLLV